MTTVARRHHNPRARPPRGPTRLCRRGVADHHETDHRRSTLSTRRRKLTRHPPYTESKTLKGNTSHALTSKLKSTLMSRLAVVTGATSGIGKAFAEQLTTDGYDLIAIGRNLDRLHQLAETLPAKVIPIAADLSDIDGINTVIEAIEGREVELLVNNAGVAHYMPFAQLPQDRVNELLFVKVIAPTQLARAVTPGMIDRQAGAIINVAGMLAYSGPAPVDQLPLRRAVYVGANAHLVAFSETLAAELVGDGITVQALCPGIVATEFHQRQGMDVGTTPRMSPHEVVTASLRGLELAEVICAPGVEDHELLTAVAAADLAAFGAQSPQLASRYRS